MDSCLEADSRQTGHLMLITPERVFYVGLLGRPHRRCPGSLHIYVALQGQLRLQSDDAAPRCGELLIVPSNRQHTIESDHRTVLCITIEPETVMAGELDRLTDRLMADAPSAASRIRAASDELLKHSRDGDIGSEAFDRICFGEALPGRALDPRVVKAIALIGRFSGEPATAGNCAALVGLSVSRFLHLFKEQTDISFRAFRAWKRARHLLHFANQNLNLAHLAQEIGYPDSTHFCHSIRRFYGLKPRAIFSGSRDLAIYRSLAPSSDLVTVP